MPGHSQSTGVRDYPLVALGRSTTLVQPTKGEMPVGLPFGEQGIRVTLPISTVAVTLQVESCLPRPIAIAGFDGAGQQVEQRVVAGDGSLHTVTLVGRDLHSFQLAGGSDGGRLVQICGASSAMQSILEDYFDPLALPTRLLPYVDVALRLFASYYLRPQEIIAQGRLGSSDGILTLASKALAGAQHRPSLGYDGFYMHSGVQSELCGESQSTSVCLSPNWEMIRKVAQTLPLTVASPTLLATVARAAGVTVAEIPQYEWVMTKAVAVLVEIGFAQRVATAAIPYLTAGTELAAAWLICAGALG